MKENITALLVQARQEPLDALRLALEKQSINLHTAKTCAEAVLALWSSCPPHIVFTEIQLTDGNWADVLTLAAKASAPVNVIVVAPFVDVSFYVQTIERGAFDFIVPPLSEPELLHVVRNAADNSIRRRRNHYAALPPAPLLTTPRLDALVGEHAAAGTKD
jgi:DNA-binding NtrC family response regulator